MHLSNNLTLHYQPMTIPAACSTSQFTCNNGNCVPLIRKCDSYDDCRDNSDEFGCGKFTAVIM